MYDLPMLFTSVMLYLYGPLTNVNCLELTVAYRANSTVLKLEEFIGMRYCNQKAFVDV